MRRASPRPDAMGAAPAAGVAARAARDACVARAAWAACVAVVAVIAVTACAPTPTRQVPPDGAVCPLTSATATCAGGEADLALVYGGGACEPPGPGSVRAGCSTRCAVQGSEYVQDGGGGITAFVGDPAVLCAETSEARAGDACAAARPCLPTRAHLAGDGTVASQEYLACGGAGACVDAPAPTIDHYLRACDVLTLLAYGLPGVAGVVADPTTSTDACLIAWDAARRAPASGLSRTCIGDWECPAGALCDDAITALAPTTAPAIAVCKPGPRGALTPAMLAR